MDTLEIIAIICGAVANTLFVILALLYLYSRRKAIKDIEVAARRLQQSTGIPWQLRYTQQGTNPHPHGQNHLTTEPKISLRESQNEDSPPAFDIAIDMPSPNVHPSGM